MSVASSAVILREQPLEGLEQLRKGRVPLRYEDVLRRAWERSEAIRQLPDTEIQVHPQFPSDKIATLISACGYCKLSVTWLPHQQAWTESFEQALRSKAEITMILAHPDSPFTRLRGEAAFGMAIRAGERIAENRRLLRNLANLGSLRIMRTDQALPFAYIEI